jgi:ankyrin repeat protein
MDLIEASKQGNLVKIRELLADGANIDEMGPPTCGTTKRHTALYAASKSNRLLVIHYLLQMGADIEQGHGYSTPLHVAISKNHIDAVRLLLQSGANVRHALYHIEDDNDAMILLILQNSHVQRLSPSVYEIKLRGASSIGRCNMVRRLLAYGVAVNAVEDEGTQCTSLHLACQSCEWPVARLLIQNFADVTLQDKDGLTPLYAS